MTKCREQAISSNHDDTSARSRPVPRSRLYAAIVISSLVLAACGGSDDDDDGDGDTSFNAATSGRFAVAMNDGVTPGTVSLFSSGLETVDRTFTTGAIQGLAIGSDGTLFQNSDGASSGIRAISQIASRVDADSFGATDRQIGTAAGKGLFLIEDQNLLVSCDTSNAAGSSDADLLVFSSIAGAQAMALGSIDLSTSCWDGAYSAVDDRMYLALVDGTLAIIDEVSALDLNSALSGSEVVSRRVTPVDETGMKVSVNLHGVGLEGSVVLLSDVGDAAIADDGALFMFSDDGTVVNNVNMTRIAGPLSMLGNPVDVILQEGDAIVAEKSNNAILVFEDVASLIGDVEPTFQTAFRAPESIVSLGAASDADNQVAAPDATDISANDIVARLLVGLNPPPVQGGVNADVATVVVIEAPRQFGVVDAELDVSLSSVIGAVGTESFTTLENIQVDAAGNGYVSFDVTTDGTDITDRGILVVSDIANRQDATLDVVSTDRAISGVNTRLLNPKGVEIVASRGAVIVADQGSSVVGPSLVVLSASGDGDVTPMFTVSSTGTAAIWDMDYDPANDRLYAAGTAGDVLVYDNFFASGVSATPTRTISPSTAGTTSNLHGIAHDSATDSLIVTDVGSPSDFADGSVYTFEFASTATGNLAPKATISGVNTGLGNPVDLAFDGTDVYIAEKLNNQVLVYRGVLSLNGLVEVAADESVAVTAPETVTLVLQ